ncbi:6,7-dimethyl-8-ribityllumazine synthase [Aestuariivirga sp.]|uniref:6,7-dimethyl-8-ribityllumazine synthase n=1 Tax=Aestuariivirga sp. TaxID=2650926 RepID=UPI0039E383C7
MSKSKKPVFACVVSSWNEGVTGGLLRGAKAYLEEQGMPLKEEHIFSAPGAFELPLIAEKIARTGKFDGVITLGCVIKGETAHFEYISLGVTHGTMMATLNSGVPIAFGVITTYTAEQAERRAKDDDFNKGREAASACLASVKTLRQVKALKSGKK